MRTLNLGILAHVDAGKTTLTERLLYNAGVIGEVGSVDHGTTQTDSLALERQRGITIKAAVASFTAAGAIVNLLDTPGHPEFIAEVERVLGVLDGAVLVVSAVEGVQAQTRVLMRTLQRLRIPTLIFVNKIDRGGARCDGVLADITSRLTPAAVALGTVHRAGTRQAEYRPFQPGEPGFAARLADVLAEHDDALLAAYVADEVSLSGRRLCRALAGQTRRALVHPVLFGSAITGAGVPDLTAALTRLFPAARGDTGGAVSGTVFKVERGPAGEKVAYVRLVAGTLRVRDRLRSGSGRPERVTGISVFGGGLAAPAPCAVAGQIAKLRGLTRVRIGDRIAAPRSPADAGPGPGVAAGEHHFAPPTLETVILPVRAADAGKLHAALTQLAEQDPLINVRQDDVRREIYLSLYGEVQKEVIEATLAGEYGIAVSFRETTTICIERPAGAGAAAEALHEPSNPFLAGLGLAVEAAAPGAGVEFRLAIEPGSLPVPFRKAVEDTVRRTLRQGLHGWQVTDAAVTLTQSGYIPPQGRRGIAFDPRISTSAGDFRSLTPLVLMAALKQAGTRVHEPVHHFRLEIPADTAGAVSQVLSRLRAVAATQVARGPDCLLEGEIPAAEVDRLQRRLAGLTRGEGILESTFARYQPVRGPAPDRARTDHNPLDRREYLLHVMRRM